MLPEPLVALAPRVFVDDHDPFVLECISYRLVKEARNPSARGRGDLCVEFVLGWSGDIGHVVESEWVEVCAKHSGGQWRPTRITTRPHGIEHAVTVASGQVVLWAEPGKHGLTGGDLSLPRDILTWMCGAASGWDGVFPFGQRSGLWGAAAERRARRVLRKAAFMPSWHSSRSIDTASVSCVPWDDFPALLEYRARNTLATVESSPGQVEVGDWNSPAPFAFVGAATYSSHWSCGGMSLKAALTRARSMQRQLILPVAVRDMAALPELWSEAWDAYSSSLVLIVGTDVVARAAAQLGFHAACSVTSLDVRWEGSWVAAASPELTELLHPSYLVLGPGLADVVLDENLSSLVDK